MTDQQHSSNGRWRRDELLVLLSTSGGLAGLCITVVALMNTFNKKVASVSIVDDLFGLCATVFLLCTYLIFWAIRTQNARREAQLTKVLEVLFLIGLTGMNIAAFMMIYTIW
jgi:hypothetical protein